MRVLLYRPNCLELFGLSRSISFMGFGRHENVVTFILFHQLLRRDSKGFVALDFRFCSLKSKVSYLPIVY